MFKIYKTDEQVRASTGAKWYAEFQQDFFMTHRDLFPGSPLGRGMTAQEAQRDLCRRAYGDLSADKKERLQALIAAHRDGEPTKLNRHQMLRALGRPGVTVALWDFENRLKVVYDVFAPPADFDEAEVISYGDGCAITVADLDGAVIPADQPDTVKLTNDVTLRFSAVKPQSVKEII